MSASAIVDAGPLVAFLVKGEAHGEWVRAQFARLTGSLYTCEPAFAEAAYLVSGDPGGPPKLIEMVRRGHLAMPFRLQEEISAVDALMRRYANVPMSLADACLVRLSELYPDLPVLTLDRDFRIYRRSGRQVIPLICPRE